MNSTLRYEKFGPEPLFSFVIPTYNRLELLIRSIHSIVALNLDFSHEIVIVDNNSEVEVSNSFVEYLKNTRWSNKCALRYYFFNENYGMYQNWNNGIILSKAFYYTILNDDDFLLPDFIELIKIVMLKKPIEAICGTIFYWNGSDEIQFKRKSKFKIFIFQIFSYLKVFKKYNILRSFHGNPLPGSLGVIFNKSIIEKIGLYNTEFGISADYEFNSRCLKSFGVLRYFHNSGLYYIHDNTSASIETTKKFIIESIKVREMILSELGFNTKSIKRLLLIKQSIFLYEHCKMFSISEEDYSHIAFEFGLNKLTKVKHILYKFNLKILLILFKPL